MNGPGFAILGLATAAPRHRIAQADAAHLARQRCCETTAQAQWLSAAYRSTRIRTRGSVLLEAPDLAGPVQHFFPPVNGADVLGPTTAQRMQRYAAEALPLALAASRLALRRSRTAAARITHLVTVSCTGFQAPGVDLQLMEALGLPRGVERAHIGFMGCHAAINTLRVARGFTAGSPAARVLVCCVELCSLHFQYGWDPSRVVANALFADGAAALVGRRAAPPAPSGWRVTATGSCQLPNSLGEISWSIGDHGFEMQLSARVPQVIRQSLRPWLTRWLRGRGLTIAGIRSWAVHPGGPRILDAITQALGLPKGTMAVSRRVLGAYGNMSSATLLFIVERLQRRHAPRPCLALAFGPGVVAEVALLDY